MGANRTDAGCESTSPAGGAVRADDRTAIAAELDIADVEREHLEYALARLENCGEAEPTAHQREVLADLAASLVDALGPDAAAVVRAAREGERDGPATERLAAASGDR